MTILRHVYLGDTGYRLHTWDTGKHCSTGQRLVGYAFYEPGVDEALFEGEDYGCSPMDSIDSDACLRGILGFLTVTEGDVDEEYFANYTERQLAWARNHAEGLTEWGMEEFFFEEGETPPKFVEVET